MRAFELAHRLFQKGIDVHPVVVPAVPEGEARLRFFITVKGDRRRRRGQASGSSGGVADLSYPGAFGVCQGP
uniref:Uncharacterized protein n=1 Tax=Candidatus Kentrum sp. LPFa TaxID=2126335 RepID=A0A450XG87_9GAMM|nr:MAG: hypothetical protein BECKLPF1236A_GA0070988_100461 [Candidatus Kentron sp. LPFa]VFK28325.1 MAG: hypothetical protein BECKLPF1236C_GA0070990_100631 [Candidatus Kentron sp. LPFa]